MDIEKQYQHVITLMKDAGYKDISERLMQELTVFKNQTYKIAVTGEFKTGKSTLINRVFLKDDILFTDLMEATAVPVEIAYDRERHLEIFPLNETSGIKQIKEPGIADIKQATSGDTAEIRAQLAKTVSRVCLTWPAGNLYGLTLFDTPGINAVTEAVIETTYRVIPESDLVLFITASSQLSAVEMAFLSGRVFAEGITRAIVVMTTDGRAVTWSDEDVAALKKSVQSQLASIGRDNIPVEMVDLWSDLTGKDTKKALKDRIESLEEEGLETPDSRVAVDAIIGNLLSDAPPETPSTARPLEDDETSSDIRSFENKLVRFLRDNVRPARMEKAALVLKTQLDLARFRCSAEMSAMTKTREERQKILNEIKNKEIEIREKYHTLSESFRKEMRVVGIHYKDDVLNGLANVEASFLAGFESCDNLGEMQGRLNRSELILRNDLEALFLDVNRDVREEIFELVEKYGTKSREILNPWQAEMSRCLSVDGGMLARIPPFAVLALDVALFARFGPFGIIADILIRILANYIPYVNKILPASIAAAILKNKIRASLHGQFDILKQKVIPKIDAAFEEVAETLLKDIHANANLQMKTVKDIMEVTATENNEGEGHEELMQKSASLLKKLDGIQRDLI